MTKTLPRLTFVAALVFAGMCPAFAGLPHNPPAPPERPEFADDAAYLQAAAAVEAAQAQQRAQEAAFPPFFAPAPQPVPEPQAALQAAPAAPPSAMQANFAPPAAPVDLRRDKKPAETVPGFDLAERAGLADMTREYARRHGVPLALLHRIIMRESRYCPHLVNRTYYGLMQITPATARSMGYHGSPQGLLDAKTNLHYATPYLANAWALADGSMDRAVQLYASGYYYTAKNKNMLHQMRVADSPPVGGVRPAAMQAANAYQAAPQPAPDPFAGIFGAGNR